jgi:hypothetical protein
MEVNRKSKREFQLKQSGLWIIAFLSLDGRVRVASALAIDRNG